MQQHAFGASDLRRLRREASVSFDLLAVNDEAIIVSGNLYCRAVADPSFENGHRQGILQAALNNALERTCAIDRVIAVFR